MGKQPGRMNLYKGKHNLGGEKIRQARKEKDMTQDQLAGQLQLYGFTYGRGTIIRIEQGRQQIPDYLLKYFALILGKPIDWFLSEDDDEEKDQ